MIPILTIILQACGVVVTLFVVMCLITELVKWISRRYHHHTHGSRPTVTIPEGVTVTPDGRSTTSPERIKAIVEGDVVVEKYLRSPRDPNHTPYLYLYCQINPTSGATLYVRNQTDTGGEWAYSVRVTHPDYCYARNNSIATRKAEPLVTPKELSDALLSPDRPDIVLYLEWFNWHGDKFQRRVTFPVLKREGNKSSGGSDRVFLGNNYEVLEVIEKK